MSCYANLTNTIIIIIMPVYTVLSIESKPTYAVHSSLLLQHFKYIHKAS